MISWPQARGRLCGVRIGWSSLHAEHADFPRDDRGAERAARVAGRLRGMLVGMEATGVYGKPVLQVMEDRFECWLLT